MEQFTFSVDPHYGDLLVSVKGLVTTDADGLAVLVNPNSPVKSLPEPTKRMFIATLIGWVSQLDSEADIHMDYSGVSAEFNFENAWKAGFEEGRLQALAGIAEDEANDAAAEEVTEDETNTPPEAEDAEVPDGDGSSEPETPEVPVGDEGGGDEDEDVDEEPTAETVASSRKAALQSKLDELGIAYEDNWGMNKLRKLLQAATK